MGFILYFDIAALALTIFLIATIADRHQSHGVSKRLFLLTSCTTATAIALDILASIEVFPIGLLFALNTAYVLVRCLISVFLFLYVCSLAKFFYRFRRMHFLYAASFIPYVILIVFVILNFWNKFVFDYVEGPKYIRGNGMYIAYGVAYFYNLVSVIIVIARRKLRTRVQFIAGMLAFGIFVGTSIVHIFAGSYLLEMLAAAFALLIFYLFIENLDNEIDFKTQNPSFNCFVNIVEQQFDRRREFSTVFIHVSNSSTIYNLYSHNEVIDFIRFGTHNLEAQVRQIDRTAVVYYLGQATFAYVFEDKSKGVEIRDLAVDYFSRPLNNGIVNFRYIATCCLAQCPEDFRDVESLIAFSNTFYEFTDGPVLDIAPYRTANGNVFFELDHILEEAIANESFELHYQPIWSVEEKRFVSAEALLRLRDSVYGLIMPGLMIPYAERRGKISQIGYIVLKKSFAFIAGKGKDMFDYLEINLSPLQLLDEHLVARVGECANAYQIRPDQVIFEVTESAAIRENPTITENLLALNKLGYRIAIDDFGTGYSNLSRLVHLPIYTLKFDKSMADLLVTDEHDRFFRSVFRLMLDNNIHVLLEGVETKELSDKVARMGVQFIQGYYYSKALKEDDLPAFIEKRTKAA